MDRGLLELPVAMSTVAQVVSRGSPATAGDPNTYFHDNVGYPAEYKSVSLLDMKDDGTFSYILSCSNTSSRTSSGSSRFSMHLVVGDLASSSLL